MDSPISFDDLIPAQPQQADVQPPPVSPQVVGPGAVFTDTRASGTPGQVSTYGMLTQTGGYDSSQPAGSIRNPYGLRAGANIPPGSWYVDQNGGVQQAGANGVQTPLAASAAPTAPQPPQGPVAAPQGGVPVDANGVINFDDLSPPVSFRSDALNSLPTAAVHAATGVLGLPGNVEDLLDAGLTPVINGGRAAFGMSPLPADPRHVEARKFFGLTVPDSADLNNDIASVTGPLYEPQTWAGRAVDTVGQFAPAALMGPEGIGLKAASVLVPAAASDAAGETARATGFPQFEGAARFVGGLAGAGAVGAVTAPSLSARVINTGAKGMTDADIQAMTAVRQMAENQGFPVTFGEGAAQLSNKGDTFLAAQRAVENTPAGAKVFGPIMQARPGQMQTAVNRFVDQIGSSTTSPSGVAPQVSDAAQRALAAEQAAINAKADPFYTASRGDLIDPASYVSIAADPSYQAALAAVRDDPERAFRISDLPDNAVGVVDEAAKRLQTMGEQVAGTPMQPGDLDLATLRQNTAQRAFQVAGQSSPTYAQARQIVAEGHAATLTPLKAGPLGGVATSQSVPQAASAVFPSQPLQGSPSEVMDALARMGAQDASVPAALVRGHIGQVAGEAFSGTRSGPNLYSGAKFGLDLMGNPIQADNLRAGLSAVTTPDVTQQLDPLVDALMAAGRRLPTRPMAPEELTAGLRASPINSTELGIAGGVAAEAAHNPLAAMAFVPLKAATKTIDAIGKARTASETEKLANTLTAPAEQGPAAIQAARTEAARRGKALAAAIMGDALSAGQSH